MEALSKTRTSLSRVRYSIAVRARVSVEQAARFGWERYVGIDGERIGMRTFGESAPLQKLVKKFGFTVDAVVTAARDQINKNKQNQNKQPS